MTIPPPSHAGNRPHQARAMTLIEVIGVITITALIAAFLLPAAVRQFDRIAAERETSTLQSFSEALQSSIIRHHTISNFTDLAAVIATEAGKDLASVTNNLRNRQRAILLDGSGWFSTTTLPYLQNSNGTSAAPINPRVMIVSSLGKPLPITSAVANTGDFNALWNIPEREVPWNNATWPGGNPEDVKIQRVNLSKLFVKLVLSTYLAGTNGQYSINDSPLMPAPRGAGVSAYFLKGTVLELYTGSPASKLNHRVILNEDISFVYEYGIWRNSIKGGESLGLTDISGIVAAFLAATNNLRAHLPQTNLQQIAIVQSLIQYLSTYNAWANSGYSGTNGPYLADILQPNMMSNVYGIFMNPCPLNNCPLKSVSPWKENHSPWNTNNCTPP